MTAGTLEAQQAPLPASSRRGSRLLSLAIDLFLVLWLVQLSNAVIPLLMLGEAEGLAAEDNAALRLLILPFIGGAPFLILARYRAMTALWLRNPLLLFLLAWVWCTVSWSYLPEISARRALGLTMFALLGAYLVLRHDLDWLLRVMGWLIFGLLVLAVLFVLLLPDLAAMPDGRGLRGVYTHKNGMGELLVMAAILLPPAIRKRLLPPLLGWLGLALTAGLLLPVNSATATVVVLVIAGTYVVVGIWQLPARLATALTALGIAAALFLTAVLAANIDLILAAFNRDATLTGRTDIWRYAWTMIERRPLLGYGYNAFWQVPSFSIYAENSFLWAVPNAHNAYLDMALSIGLIGLGLLLLFLGGALLRRFRALGSADPVPAMFLIALFVSVLVRAILETNLLGQNSIVWTLIMVFTLLLTPGIEKIRKR
jgi:O-antigen ligase